MSYPPTSDLPVSEDPVLPGVNSSHVKTSESSGTHGKRCDTGTLGVDLDAGGVFTSFRVSSTLTFQDRTTKDNHSSPVGDALTDHPLCSGSQVVQEMGDGTSVPPDSESKGDGHRNYTR